MVIIRLKSSRKTRYGDEQHEPLLGILARCASSTEIGSLNDVAAAIQALFAFVFSQVHVTINRH